MRAVQSAPGRTQDLTAVIAPSARAAAEYYPANYWLALLQFPPASEFPGTGPQGNGIPVTYKTQDQWVSAVKCAATALDDQQKRPWPDPLLAVQGHDAGMCELAIGGSSSTVAVAMRHTR